MKNRFSNREKIALILLASITSIYMYMQLYLNPIMERKQFLKQQINKYSSITEIQGNTNTAESQGNENNASSVKLAGAHDVDVNDKKTNASGKSIQERYVMAKNSEIAYNMMIKANQANVQMQTLEIGEVIDIKSDPKIGYVPVEAKFSGSLDKLLQLLQLLEKQDETCALQQVDILKSDKSQMGVGVKGVITTAGAISDLGKKQKTLASLDKTVGLAVNLRYFFIGVD